MSTFAKSRSDRFTPHTDARKEDLKKRGSQTNTRPSTASTGRLNKLPIAVPLKSSGSAKYKSNSSTPIQTRRGLISPVPTPKSNLTDTTTKNVHSPAATPKIAYSQNGAVKNKRALTVPLKSSGQSSNRLSHSSSSKHNSSDAGAKDKIKSESSENIMNVHIPLVVQEKYSDDAIPLRNVPENEQFISSMNIDVSNADGGENADGENTKNITDGPQEMDEDDNAPCPENNASVKLLRSAKSDLALLKNRLNEATTCMAEVCLQALLNRDNVMEWVFKLMADYETDLNSSDKVEMVNKFKEEGELLGKLLEEVKNRTEIEVDCALENSKKKMEEIENVKISDENKNWLELKQLRKELHQLQTLSKDERYQDLFKKLALEKAVCAEKQDKLVATEVQLRNAKIRILKLEKQLKETDSSLGELKDTMKHLEDQSKHRDVQLEAKARKAREAYKTNELAVQRITQQKESLENKLTELNEEIDNLKEKHAEKVNELKQNINNLTSQLKQKSADLARESEMRSLAEQTVNNDTLKIEELQSTIENLKSRMPDPEAPTEREIAAWAETAAIKEALQMAENELEIAKREKLHMIETLTADNCNANELEQKLGTELKAKEELIGQMQNKIRELSKSCKLNELKLEQYDKHLKNLHLYKMLEPSNGDSNDGALANETLDPQRELMELRLNLLETAQKNEELLETVRAREESVERYEKNARAQSKLIKVREELIKEMEKKEAEQAKALGAIQRDLQRRMEIVDDVNKQIAGKAEEIQQLFLTLESKQNEIQRREKIIRALEEQLNRAQALRIHQEEKITLLQHELFDTAARRRQPDKKLLFF